MRENMDSRAIATIVEILNANDQWSSDELDAIADVLDAVLPRGDNKRWDAPTTPLTWSPQTRSYVY